MNYAPDSLLTTGQAAELLNVSQDYLEELLDKGTMPFETEETEGRRLVKFADLVAHKARQAAESDAAQDAAQAQELGMGY